RSKKFDKNSYANCINKIVESNHSILKDIYGIVYEEDHINYLKKIKNQLNTVVKLSENDTDELKDILSEIIDYCYIAIGQIYSFKDP
ncbi:TPA: hypothetical protein QC102_004728, partial [Bacillus cereus]|nr:hypothetical protein [Bacillus cereus]HDR8418176.1 hypothetical protein [Bacillus cereus]